MLQPNGPTSQNMSSGQNNQGYASAAQGGNGGHNQQGYQDRYAQQDGNQNMQDDVNGSTPWYIQDAKVQAEDGEVPPPVFSSQPRTSMSLPGRRGSMLQQQVCRMDYGIDPVNLLCDRLSTWRVSIKTLVKMFKSIHDAESKSSKGYCNASKNFALPSETDPNKFVHSGGIQDVWLAFKNYSLEEGTLRQDYVHYIERALLPGLRGIKTDIKTMIGSIRKDPELRNQKLYDSRLTVDRLVSRLDKNLKTITQVPEQADQIGDPLLLSQGKQSIKTLYDQENTLHDQMLNLQQEVCVFEQNVVESLRLVFQEFKKFRLESKIDSPSLVNDIEAKFNAIRPQTEWKDFVQRNQFNLVREDATYKSDRLISYPNQNHHLVQPIKEGPLERKSALRKSWVEGFYILSPAGFLHGYKSPDMFYEDPMNPESTVFLPRTKFSTDNTDEDGTFELRGKDAQVTLGLEKTFIFRAINDRDLNRWLKNITQCMERYKPMPMLPGPEYSDESSMAGYQQNNRDSRYMGSNNQQGQNQQAYQNGQYQKQQQQQQNNNSNARYQQTEPRQQVSNSANDRGGYVSNAQQEGNSYHRTAQYTEENYPVRGTSAYSETRHGGQNVGQTARQNNAGHRQQGSQNVSMDTTAATISTAQTPDERTATFSPFLTDRFDQSPPAPPKKEEIDEEQSLTEDGDEHYTSSEELGSQTMDDNDDNWDTLPDDGRAATTNNTTNTTTTTQKHSCQPQIVEPQNATEDQGVFKRYLGI
ncbi:hypothetical protein J3Q64DRAFT_1670813 [Phycomyces blakesleeanus]|uniref:PH domain-containing protein n=1 Tax=Phycomyces blakesleeanus TaxID=4837 RepID=A0ABR3BGV3_PHYBL